MTPKEKAKELYNKYEFVYIQNYTSKHEVKECALIAMDEIISIVEWYDVRHISNQLKFWNEVKNEIDKL